MEVQRREGSEKGAPSMGIRGYAPGNFLKFSKPGWTE